ncbi:MAG: hypothetical protein JSW73_05485 [Candidatus Woesearchaeota archaeon]|nr:MAG: hypothetical protein JSW73_05485 [Candidatus Woesearchaeota archaeon]
MGVISKLDLMRHKKIMEDILEIDRQKAEIVAQLVPLIKDFYETWHSREANEKRLYKLFSKPQKNETVKEEELAYRRDLEDLEKEKEDLRQIKRLIRILESYDEDLIRELNLLNS